MSILRKMTRKLKDRFLFFLFSLHASSQRRWNIKQSKATIGPGELQRNNEDVTVVRNCVVSVRVFSQCPAIYCTRRRGMETSCLHFQLASELRSVCWTVVFPPSVAVPRSKYMRGNGRWPRSRPGSGFCGVTEFVVFILC